MKKKLFIGFLTFIMMFLVVISALYLNFINSWRYTRYQIILSSKYQNAEAIKYFDCEKISDNQIQRNIWQSKNLDNALDRPHDDNADIFAYEMYKSNKEIFVKNIELTVKELLENAPKNLQKISNLKLFWMIYNDKAINPNFSFNYKKISPQKIEVIDINNNKNEDYTSVYEKVNKKWIITDVY